MSDQNPAQALPPLSSSEVLEVLYGRRKHDLSREKPTVASQSGEITAVGPDAIWGHYNNYRSMVCLAPQSFTSH